MLPPTEPDACLILTGSPVNKDHGPTLRATVLCKPCAGLLARFLASATGYFNEWLDAPDSYPFAPVPRG